MNGDKAAVKALIKQAADINAAQGDGMTALHWAAMNGDTELAQMLVFAGANVKATTRIGSYTPLYIASQQGNAAVLRGADQGGRRCESRDGQRHDAADGGRAGGQRRRREGADRAAAPTSTPRTACAIRRL